MRKPNQLICIHLNGEVLTNFASILDDFPDRTLSGDFYETVGLDKPGKEIKIKGKDVQVQFFDYNEHEGPWFSHVKIYFFNLANQTNFSQVGDFFDLTTRQPNKFTQTVIGLIAESIHITQKDRSELTNHESIEYH